MSLHLEIADFIRLTRGLSSATLAKAIRRRWPQADTRQIRLAFHVVASGAAYESDVKVNGVQIVAPLI